MKRLLFFSIISIFCLTASAQNWVQLGNDINGEAPGDAFGDRASLSADGNTVAVGARKNSGNGNNAGHVRVFAYNGTSWMQKGSDIDGAAAEDSSNRVGLSADGNTVAIGAPYNDEAGDGYGHVRVFDFNGTDWVQRGASITGEVNNDQSGWSVGISADGNKVVIGARGDEGRVRVYGWNGSAWAKLGSTIYGANQDDAFGGSVAITADGTTFIAGAANAGNGRGEVRIYQYNGTDWVMKGNLISGDYPGLNFGSSVGISADGNTIISGSPNFDNVLLEVIGRVQAFSYNGSSWIQKGQSIEGIADGDYLGTRVAINAGGNLIATRGSHDSAGNNAKGRAIIYHYVNDQWNQVGSPIDGQNNSDQCGFDLSFSSSGETISVGSPGSSGNGSNSGQERVFGLDGPLEITNNEFGSIVLFPNPSNGNFTMDMGKEYTDVTVELYNMLGQIISSDKYTSAKIIEQKINASVGIYFVKVSTPKEGSRTLRIIKQ